MPWYDGPMFAYDCEATSVEVETARIVSACLLRVDPNNPTVRSGWLIDPGIEIPDESVAVHGITTERARVEGRPAAGAIGEIVFAMRRVIREGLPIVIQNAPYDLTLLDREARRHLIEPPDWSRLLVVDCLVLDRWADQFRRSYPRGHTPESAAEAGILSSRSLGGMCAHYGVELDGAHDADADALAAARLAYRMLHRSDFVQGKHPEIIARRARWKALRDDLLALQIAQMGWRSQQSDSLRAWFEKQGETEKAASVSNDWPVIPFEAKVEA